MVLLVGARMASGQRPLESEIQDYRERAAELKREIAAAVVAERYCTAVERNAEGQRLLELQAKLDKLVADWNKFRQSKREAAQKEKGAGAYANPDKDPTNRNFWATDDNVIVVDTQRDLDQQIKAWKASSLMCARPSSTAPTDTQPRTPQPPKKRDGPPAGLKRPDLPTATVLPKAFCDSAELEAWRQQVIGPLLNTLIQATNPSRDYIDAVRSKLAAAERATPPDPNAIKDLEDELKWAQEKHQELDETIDEVFAALKNSTVVDCNHNVVPAISGQREDSTKGVRKDSLPPVGGDSKPANTPTTTPRVGMLPRRSGTPYGGFVQVNGGFNDFWRFRVTESLAPGITASDATQIVGAYGGSIGWKFKNRLGLCGSFRKDRRTYDQIIGTERLEGQLDELFYWGDFFYSAGWNDWSIEGIGGLVGALDKLNARADSINAAYSTRKLTTYKTHIGVAVERRISNSISLGVENHIMTGWHVNDADLSYGASATLRIYIIPKLAH